jgi:isochorismate hydrolase
MARTVEVPQYEVDEDVRLDPARTALVVVDMQNDLSRRAARSSSPTRRVRSRP